MLYQPPAYTPLTLPALARSGIRALSDPTGVRRELEARLADRLDAQSVLLLGSGTEALQVALAIATSGGSGPVALPAYSCYDVVTAAIGADVQATFYDIVPATLTPDLPDVRAALAGGARTVVAGYLFGYPIDWDALRAECARFGAILVEDAAQGVGASWRGRPAGAHGDLAVLSFGRGKGWTGGGGGAVIARESRLAEGLDEVRSSLPPSTAATSLPAAVACAVQWLLGRPGLYGVPARLPALRLGETAYKDPTPPTLCPSFACAAVLEHERAAFAEAGIRRRNAAAWSQALLTMPGQPRLTVCEPIAGGTCGFLRLPVVLAEGANEAAATTTRLARFGVGRGYPLPLSSLSQARSIHAGERTFRGASALADGLITLPTHSRTSARTDTVRELVTVPSPGHDASSRSEPGLSNSR